LYYSACGKVDQHNHDRQDTLQLERKIGTHSWVTRVNHTILAMCVVDSWKIYSHLAFGVNQSATETQGDFHSQLVAELIDNTYDQVGAVRRSLGSSSGSRRPDTISLLDASLVSNITSALFNDSANRPHSGLDLHITPTSKKRKNREGEVVTGKKQSRCLVCSKKTSYLCSWCSDRYPNEEVGWVCHTCIRALIVVARWFKSIS
jgi:hypothetical protein